MSTDQSSSPFFLFPSGPIAMDSETSFFLAIKNNHVEVVEKLVSTKSVDVDHKFAPENKPAVFLAVESGHREIVLCLVRYGCSVNQADRRGETPLHQAVRDRRKDLIEILLKERAKVCVLNSDRLTALHLAVYLRCIDIVKILVNANYEAVPTSGSSLNSTSENHLNLIYRSDHSGIVSPFSLACSKGYDEIVTYFLSFLNKETARKLFSIHRSIIDSTNPFNYALRFEEDTVVALIDTLPVETFLVGSRDDYMKWSPLHRLAQADHMLQAKSGRIATLLLTRARAPTDLRDLNGRTPLHWAIIRRNEPVIEALLRAGCRTDIRDQYGNSALHYAVLACTYNLGSIGIIERLLAFGLDLARERWLTTMMERDQHAYTGNILLGALAELKQSTTLISLQRICRTAIRDRLKPGADEAIGKLDCLPQALKVFLSVENEPEVLGL